MAAGDIPVSTAPVLAENTIPAGLRWKDPSKGNTHEPGRGRGTWGKAPIVERGTSRLPARRSMVRKGSRRSTRSATLILSYSMPTHGTAARRVMSFAPGAGASETTFMLARVPAGPRYLRARMSSMARSKNTIGQSRRDVNRGTAPRQTRANHLTHQVSFRIREVPAPARIVDQVVRGRQRGMN